MRDLTIAISFANLCYLKVWWDLLAPRGYEFFFYDAPPQPVHYIAVILNVLLLGAVVWALRPRKAYLLLMAIPLLAARNSVSRTTALAHPFSWLEFFRGTRGRVLEVLFFVLVIGAVIMAVRHAGRVATGVQAVLALLFVVFPIFCAQGAWQAAHRVEWPAALRRQVQTPAKHRFVWIIFDEMDYALTFVNRPADLAMPQFDRLQAGAFSAAHAYPPAGRTNLSIPALLSGRFVSKMQPAGPSDARITFEAGSTPLSIRSLAPGTLPQVMVGWWFPYSRLFGDVSRCEDCETEGAPFLYGSEFWPVLGNQIRTLFETEERSPFGQTLFMEKFRGCYEHVMSRGQEMAADKAYQSVFIHVPAPHDPFFYDRKTGRPDRKNPTLKNYFDELALADQAMGRLRTAMERAGVWDSSTVVVSSDHWFRAKGALGYATDHRVPFLVKRAGQTKGERFDEPFNTVLTKQLMEDLENEKVRGTGEWLLEHRGNVTESPYSAK